MKHLIAQKDVSQIALMIRQLRSGYADPARSAYEKSGYLWLGNRYQAAYVELTGAPLPHED